MLRRLLLLAAFAGAIPAFAAPAPPTGPVSKIVFGSCADQNKPCPIWEKIVDYKPELTILLGDNIYADIEEGKLKPADPAKIERCYGELAKLEVWKKLATQTTFLATWDDHDYGHNDAGVEWEHKDAAQKLFLDFFGVPADSPLRTQKGVYNAAIFGPEGKRVQVIMLDTRYFRSPVAKEKKVLPGTTIRPYILNTDPDATVLGKDQWEWFAEQLKKPAEIRLIGSSIQLVTDEHPFEKWGNFPEERKRFFKLIKESGANGVIILSGDRHLGEISVEPKAAGYPLYDITSSGFNQASQTFREVEKNAHRVASMPWGNNFGTIAIDWAKPDPLIQLQLRDDDAEIVAQVKIPLSKLQAKAVAAASADPLVLVPGGVLSPVEALKKKEGDEITVQFVVNGGRLVGKRILLNSEKVFSNENNFTVVVNDKAWTGVFDKATYDTFKGKTIRAKGKVSKFKEAFQLEINDAKDLEIVEPKKDEEKKDEKKEEKK